MRSRTVRGVKHFWQTCAHSRVSCLLWLQVALQVGRKWHASQYSQVAGSSRVVGATPQARTSRRRLLPKTHPRLDWEVRLSESHLLIEVACRVRRQALLDGFRPRDGCGIHFLTTQMHSEGLRTASDWWQETHEMQKWRIWSAACSRSLQRQLWLVDSSTTPDPIFCSVLLFLWLPFRLELSIGVEGPSNFS